MSSTLPAHFELVVGVAAISALVHHGYMTSEVMRARKKYGVKYPDLYATKENCANEEDRQKFNCVQRGHQNSLELHAAFLSLLTLAGLKHPVVAASAGAVYILGRLIYFKQYSTGVPEKRVNGGPLYLSGLFTLVGTCAKIAATSTCTRNKK